jgi:hypothetical protein
MAKRVFLHTGLPKTGTTALQETLFASRDALVEHGYGYWSLTANHSTPLALLFENDGHNQAWIDRRGALMRKEIGGPGRFRRHLLTEIEATPDTFIISGEGMSKFPPSQLIFIDELVRSTGAECIPLLYLREPRSHLTSSAQQKLKSGKPIAAHLVSKEDAPENWGRDLLEVFGRQRLVIRAYRGQDFLDDFFREVRLPIRPQPVSVNESFSHEAAMWLDAVNSLAYAEGGYAFANPLRQHLQATMPGPRFQLPTEVLDAFVAHNAARLDFLSELLGEDIRGLPSTVAPPPEITPPDPRLVRTLFELAKAAGDLRSERRLARSRQNNTVLS